MVFTSTTDEVQAAFSALYSYDGKEDVSFHIFTLPEDGCVRLLVNKLGRDMLESAVRDELESLNVLVRGVTHLRSGRRD
jgi:hypothetical protein